LAGKYHVVTSQLNRAEFDQRVGSVLFGALRNLDLLKKATEYLQHLYSVVNKEIGYG
jgi:hypothetical protein